VGNVHMVGMVSKYIRNTGELRFALWFLLQSCEALGMKCSRLSLYHLDPGPGNILSDVDTNMMSVIDFECVGYVPDDIIRTKFRICSGLDLSCCRFDDDARTNWRVGVQRRLGKLG
jgi:hypothetical protein